MTNFSINKKNRKFFTDENSNGDGFKWKLKTLEEKMIELGHDWDKIYNNISDIVIKTILSIE